jgi:hypothetical protein
MRPVVEALSTPPVPVADRDPSPTGNSHARRVLAEAAWNYRFPARISRVLEARLGASLCRQFVNSTPQKPI